MNDPVKQIIVMRTKFSDVNGGSFSMRKGKMVAQGSHASMSFLARRFQAKNFNLSKAEQLWLEGSFAKICVGVDSEEELIDIYNKAKEAQLEVHMITDSGKTEFHNVPTRTCLAIGPDFSSKIDPITSKLKLL
jgi:PTH2 family peptidyl-tRNA hydrolase